jgi:hypothetical protein
MANFSCEQLLLVTADCSDEVLLLLLLLLLPGKLLARLEFCLLVHYRQMSASMTVART